MMLEMDAGNTLIKWRVLSAGAAVLARGVVADLAGLQSALSDRVDIQRVRLACVRDKPFAQQLSDWTMARWQVSAEIANVSPRHAGVTNAYQQYGNLGIDRWLAMLAAFNRTENNKNSPCCIISCGTAITLDMVDSSGLHLGGYIVPGLHLQRQSLLHNTAIKLPEEKHWLTSWFAAEPGRSTADAVNHGIYAMVSGWLASHPAVVTSASAGRLYLTGGDAVTLAQSFKVIELAHHYEKDLVLDGLAYALP